MAASRKKKRKKYFVTASGALLLLSAAQLQLPARPLLIPIGRAAPCPCARCFLLLASRPCTAPRTHPHPGFVWSSLRLSVFFVSEGFETGSGTGGSSSSSNRARTPRTHVSTPRARASEACRPTAGLHSTSSSDAHVDESCAPSTDDDGRRRRRPWIKAPTTTGTGNPRRRWASWAACCAVGASHSTREPKCVEPSHLPFLSAPWMNCVPWCHFHVYFLTAAGTGQQKTHSARERGRCHHAAQGPTRPAAQGSSSLASPA